MQWKLLSYILNWIKKKRINKWKKPMKLCVKYLEKNEQYDKNFSHFCMIFFSLLISPFCKLQQWIVFKKNKVHYFFSYLL